MDSNIVFGLWTEFDWKIGVGGSWVTFVKQQDSTSLGIWTSPDIKLKTTDFIIVQMYKEGILTGLRCPRD